MKTVICQTIGPKEVNQSKSVKSKMSIFNLLNFIKINFVCEWLFSIVYFTYLFLCYIYGIIAAIIKQIYEFPNFLILSKYYFIINN